MDVDKLISLLNKALSDEWLAYYQYWTGAKVVKGPMKDAVIAELDLHATEELGGIPVLTPEDWFKLTNCGYDGPGDPYVEVILDQNIKGEQCAIKVYNNLRIKLLAKLSLTLWYERI